MTERAVELRASSRHGRGGLAAVWAALVAFLVLLALLAVRVSAGQDPALRARAAALAPPPRRVLVRRVIERRVIVHLPPSAPAGVARPSQQLSAIGAGAFPIPVTRTS